MIPAMLFLVVMALCRILPFGDSTLLLWDAEGQYVSFLTAWRRTLLGQADAFYTLSRDLGGSMTGIISYYLASPLNLLLVLFPEDAMLHAFGCIVLLKIGLCGLCCAAYLVLGRRMGRSALLFSTSYALMGFVACYFWDIMWLDGIALLPLIAWGIERLLLRRGFFLYVIALGLALWSNYYIGYILCLFSVLYFVYVYVCNRRDIRFWSASLRFAGASLLAAGLACAMLVPAFFALQKGYSVFDMAGLSLERRFPLVELTTKLFTGAVDYGQVRTKGLPALYVGIPVLLLAACFFLDSGVHFRRRIMAALPLLVLALSFQNGLLYMLWHGFDPPNAMPARFSFLFSFWLILLAAEEYKRLGAIPPSVLLKRMAILAAALLIGAYFLFKEELPTYLAYETLCFDALCMLLGCWAVVMIGRGTGKRKAIAIAGLCILQAACLVINGFFSIRRLEEIDTLRASAYRQETSAKRAILAQLPKGEGVYRIETNDARNENDALQYGYAGLSHYSSDVQGRVAELFSKLGQRQLYMRFDNANGLTPVAESLFGVRYVLWRTDADAALAQTPYHNYQALFEQDGIVVYENPYALPLAVMVPETQTYDPLASDDPFVNQNALLSDWIGQGWVEALHTVQDVAYEADDEGLRVCFATQEDRVYYMHTSATWFSLDGAVPESYRRFASCAPLPQKTGETILKCFGESDHAAFALAWLDETVFEQAMGLLAERACEVESETDSHFRIRATAQADCTQLLLTLPYDAGWSVWVDGEPWEAVKRYDTLLAVDLPEGTHEVTLRFVPQGLAAGTAVSAVSLVLLCLLALRKRRRMAKKP